VEPIADTCGSLPGQIGLAGADVELRGRLGGEVADSLAEGVFLCTNGNPMFMLNLIEDLVQRQLLVRNEGLWTASSQAGSLDQAMPETLRSLISRRLEALTQDERSALESASWNPFGFQKSWDNMPVSTPSRKPGLPTRSWGIARMRIESSRRSRL